MARNVLRGANSYTLIKPNTNERIVIRRGQAIDNLDEADQAYLGTKTITPPVVDDSHPPMGAMPIFSPALDEDVKGEAAVEQIATPQATEQPYATGGPAEKVTVSVEAATADADDADGDAKAEADEDGAAAGGADDSGGGDAKAAAPAAPTTQGSSKKGKKGSSSKRRKPASKKKS